MTDYSKFKTPYFKISIGDVNGKNMTELPPQIARLVEKVEIAETLCCNTFNQITITFVEGSREPFGVAKGKYAPNSVYPSGGDGLLSNQSGSLVDIRMSSGGLTSALPGELASVANLEAVGALTTAVGNISGILDLLGKDNTTPEKIFLESEVEVPADKNLQYLLQQRNQVQVTWGYKEDPTSERTMRTYIMITTSQFPESGTPRTTVVCHSAAAIADQVTASTGKLIGTKTEAGKDESGNTLYDWSTDNLAKVLDKMCTEMDIKCIISNSFRAEALAPGKVYHWPAGQSLHQFFTKLSKDHHAIYKLLINPSTGKDTLIFLNKDDFEKYPVIEDERLLTYKGNGSIIKSINIKADFGQPIGSFLKTVSDEGGEMNHETKTITHTIFEPAAQQANNPTSTNVSQLAKGAGKYVGGTTGYVAIDPESSPSRAEDLSKALTNRAAGRLLALDFTTLGMTQLTPGPATFSGIGDRYTGVYKIQTVTHVLDSSGYNCRGMAISHTNAAGGVSVQSEEIKADKKKTIHLFDPVNEPVADHYQTFIKNKKGAN